MHIQNISNDHQLKYFFFYSTNYIRFYCREPNFYKKKILYHDQKWLGMGVFFFQFQFAENNFNYTYTIYISIVYCTYKSYIKYIISEAISDFGSISNII